MRNHISEKAYPMGAGLAFVLALAGLMATASLLR